MFRRTAVQTLRHRTALGLLGNPLTRSWKAQGFAPDRGMGLQIGELRQLGTKLHESEAATQEGVQQGPSSDGGSASEGERGVSHLPRLCFQREPRSRHALLLHAWVH